MSLRRRLLLSLGISFCVLWTLAAAWLYGDLRAQMRKTLDQRLAASARMVAGLVSQLPAGAWADQGQPVLSIPQSTGVACQVSSPSGQVLLRTHGEFAGRLDAPTAGFTERIINGERWRLFTYVQNGLHITTADRLAERTTLQRNVVVVAAVPFLIALLGSLVVLWLGVRRGLRPLERLRAELSRRDPDTLTPVDIAGAPTELAPAIATLNRLLVRTGEALQREQRFTSDAAHELRTPLTAIKTHVQLLSRLPPAQAGEALASARTGIDRLQQTLEQLLLLARVEADVGHGPDTDCRGRDIINTALADLPASQRIEVRDRIGDARAALPCELAATALRNLLENALRHSPDTSPVLLEASRDGRMLVFVVADHGDWPAGHSTRPLTRRFWRGPRHDGKPQATQGSGLGLAIVAAIVERFHGRLEFSARDRGGLKVCLVLPSAPA